MISRIIRKLYDWSKNKVQRSCEHEYEKKDYAYCVKCDKRHPSWRLDGNKELPWPLEKEDVQKDS